MTKSNHDFTRTPGSVAEAIAIQQELRKRVVLEDVFGELRTIAGIDVGYDYTRKLSRAALVVLRDGKVVEEVVAYDATPFPYVPGLLSFREAPVILKALAQLREPPDLLFVDGHGVAHPRRLGIAAHIGVLTGLPTLGVAKKRLCGEHREPGAHKGAACLLKHAGERIGTVLRTRPNVKPVFVSPGHRVSHATAVALVKSQLAGYRLPEPTRLADKLSKTK
jgi:deoxyribonuclease V